MKTHLNKITELIHSITTSIASGDHNEVSQDTDSLVETAMDLQSKVETYVLKAELTRVLELNKTLQDRIEELEESGN